MFEEIFHLKCIECGAVCGGKLPVCPDCLKKLPKYLHKCENCGFPTAVPAKTCGKCLSEQPWDKIRIDYPYQGVIRTLIKDIKFRYRITGSSELALLVNPPEGRYDLVIPVPSHYTRRLRRYVHPATVIAKQLSKSLNCPMSKDMVRTRKTEYQYKLKSHLRQKNVKNAFSCKRDLIGLKILLVDDIITTGATISECCKVLRKSGASVIDVYALAGGVR